MGEYLIMAIATFAITAVILSMIRDIFRPREPQKPKQQERSMIPPPMMPPPPMIQQAPPAAYPHQPDPYTVWLMMQYMHQYKGGNDEDQR